VQGSIVAQVWASETALSQNEPLEHGCFPKDATHTAP